MKKILMIMLVMLPMMVFSSCSKDDERATIDEALVGTWEFVQEGGKDVIIFSSNGSFRNEIYVLDTGKYILQSSMDDTYNVEDNLIILTNSEIGWYYTVSGNTLTLTGKEHLTYTRVK